MSATKQPINGKRCYFHIKHDIWTFGYIIKEESGYYTGLMMGLYTREKYSGCWYFEY